MNKNGTKGFSLVELLMVVAIIGILAAIAIPNLLNAIARAKQKRTMTEIRNIATAWEARAADLGRYNAAGTISGIDVEIDGAVLSGALSPTYMKVVPLHDAWTNPLKFYSSAAFGDTPATRYAILSPGRDGIEEPTFVPGVIRHYDCDIIYSNGVFLAYPEGTQASN